MGVGFFTEFFGVFEADIAVFECFSDSFEPIDPFGDVEVCAVTHMWVVGGWGFVSLENRYGEPEEQEHEDGEQDDDGEFEATYLTPSGFKLGCGFGLAVCVVNPGR